MTPFLHKVGIWAYTSRWKVVGMWIGLVVILGCGALFFSKPTTSEISIPGTSAQTAIDRVGNLFPDAGSGSGRIVFHTPNKTIADYSAPITNALGHIKDIQGVSSVVSPFDYKMALSADGKTAYAQVQLDRGEGQDNTTTLAEIARVTDELRTNELQVERAGDLINNVPSEILGPTEVIGLLIAITVLVMTFGSLIAAGLPVATALVAVGASMAGLFALSKIVSINSTTPALSIMLGLAVGIDYSLFIIAKYRTLLLRGHTYQDAAAEAISTAGNAVIFAASTVIIALSALSVVRIPFMTVMGLSGAATIGVTALAAITLVPAMLGIAGKNIFSKKTAKMIETAQAKAPTKARQPKSPTIWHRFGSTIIRRPLISIICVLILVGAMALPARQLTLGIPTDQYAASDTTQRKAYNLLSDAFGVGFNAPLIVLAENVPAVSDNDRSIVRTTLLKEFENQAMAAAASQQAQFEQRLAAITTPEEAIQIQAEIATAQAAAEQTKQMALSDLETKIAQYARLYQLNVITAKLAQLKDVQSVTPVMVTDSGDAGIIQVIPNSAPADQRTTALIAALRNKPLGDSPVTLAVTGSTALQNDINKKLSDALPVYLAVVIGLSLILLTIAFRSILIPIKATFGFLLSVLAMFGVLVAVFQWGWLGIAAPAPIVSFIPIIGIGILFGLAMDYEFFLVSSMHEIYDKTGKPRSAIINGFSLGAKVVTAAAAIMIAVFAGFVGNTNITIQAIGFGLAVGILVDAFLIRMIFVPAVMILLDKSAWWLPNWLEKWLPHMSIEGSELKNKSRRRD